MSLLKRVAILASLFVGIAAAESVPVHVLIDFPDREDLDIAVTYEEVVELTGDKHPYKVKFWVNGAFTKAGLKYDIEKAAGNESVRSIQGVANDTAARWVYFVDGIRSPYHINTQTAPQPRTIRFKFEKK